MTKTTNKTDFSKKRSFLLVAPMLVIPFVCGAFYALGGGKGAVKDQKMAAGMGFNMELPKPKFDPKEKGMNKLGYYLKADKDSIKKREFRQLDPYQAKVAPGASAVLNSGRLLNGPVRLAPVKGVPAPEDPKADELLRRLEGLKKVMAHSQEVERPEDRRDRRFGEVALAGFESKPIAEPVRPIRRIPVDTPAQDPQLERINEMLDKIIRIQHPVQEASVTDIAVGMPPVDTAYHDRGSVRGVVPVKNRNPMEGKAEELSANTLPAVVEGKQKLVAGATIALRLTEEALIDGIRMPRDQLLYGMVSIHNDRMGVHINSIRNGLTLYNVSIDVYDMDGQPGIHIRDMSLKQVTKESADLGVGSLNLLGYDPTIGAQAANAGVQAVKSLFRRKVRPVRVAVKNGYPVLLRDMRTVRMIDGFRVLQDSTHAELANDH